MYVHHILPVRTVERKGNGAFEEQEFRDSSENHGLCRLCADTLATHRQRRDQIARVAATTDLPYHQEQKCADNALASV